MGISIPIELLDTVLEFRTCEFTTLSKRGSPVTWPVSARYLPSQGHFLLTSSIGYPQKAYNIRRNPRVSLLFSNPTGSELINPTAVLVQGDAVVSDQITTSPNDVEGLREFWLESIYKRQPAATRIPTNPLTRRFIDWFYMRVVITVTPRAVYYWPEGDFSKPASQLEATHVA